MIKLNRIGNKLGLAGAVGILLAIGMVANQMVTESKIEEAGGRATRSQQVADNSLSAHIDLRRIQLAARDVRLARTSAEVGKAVADLQRYKASEAKELEAAFGMAQRPETRERLQKTMALMEGFAAAVEDLAKAQTTLLAQIDKRSAVSEEWTKAVDTQLSSPAMAKLDNRLEIERLLFQADAKVNALRAAAWKLGATGDANLVAEMGKTEASLKDVFNKLRGEADDRDLLVVVSNLSSIVKRFLAADEKAVKTEQLKNDIIANRTVKAAADAAELMEATVDGAQQDAKDLQGRGHGRYRACQPDQPDHGDRRRRLADCFGRVFLPRGRAPDDAPERCARRDGRRRSRRRNFRRRPRRRNRRPRQDGDRHSRERGAKGARGSRSKVKEDQVAAQKRKAEMIKLADDFEGAVGQIVETVSSASTELKPPPAR